MGTVTWLPGQSGNRGSILGRGVSFASSPQQSGREGDRPLSDARVKNERSVLVLRPPICLGYQLRVISECGH